MTIRTDERRPGPTRFIPHLFALCSYLALTLVLTYPLIREFTRAIPGDGFDGWQNVWNLWWVKRALLVEGSNPYFTRLLDYPAGVYLHFHTLNIFNGLTFLPLTLNAGALVAYNSAALFSFVVGGYGSYLLALWLLPAGCPAFLRHLAAFVSGFVFVFSPYHMAHLLGHMQLISLEWLPFYALVVLMLLRRVVQAQGRWLGSTLSYSALAALLLVLVALCDWYYAFYMALLSLLFWAWAVARQRTRAAAARASVAMAMTGLFFLLATAVLWIPMVQETLRSDYMVPPAESVERLSADLSAFLTPSTLHPWWGAWVATWAERFTASLSERTVFVGYSVLALALIALLGYRRRAALWGVAALLFAILALGPWLHIGGTTRFGAIGPLPLPYLLLHQLVPLLRVARSVSRFSVVVMLALGVLAALGSAWLLQKAEARSGSQRSKGLPGLITLALIGVIGLEYLAVPYPVSFPETHPFHYQLAREAGAFAVMDIPMDEWDRPANLLFQTVHGKPLISGYTSRPNPLAPAWRTPVLQTFRYLAPDINSGDASALAETVLADLNVRYVIVHKHDLPPGTYRTQTLELAERVFGAWPLVVDDEWLKVFRRPDVPARWLPYLVLGAGWGERTWDGRRPARPIRPPRATLQAHMPAAGEVILEIEAYAAGTARLRVVAANDEVAELALQQQPVGQRIPLSLPAGETPITLEVASDAAVVMVQRLELAMAAGAPTPHQLTNPSRACCNRTQVVFGRLSIERYPHPISTKGRCTNPDNPQSFTIQCPIVRKT